MIRNIFRMHDMDHLKAGLEATWQEQLETSHNLANAETEDFKAKNTDFRAILMPDSGATPPKGEAYQMYLESLEEETDFNLELEMRRMSQASLAGQAYAKVLLKRYQDLRTVMREGR